MNVLPELMGLLYEQKSELYSKFLNINTPEKKLILEQLLEENADNKILLHAVQKMIDNCGGEF